MSKGLLEFGLFLYKQGIRGAVIQAVKGILQCKHGNSQILSELHGVFPSQCLNINK